MYLYLLSSLYSLLLPVACRYSIVVDDVLLLLYQFIFSSSIQQVIVLCSCSVDFVCSTKLHGLRWASFVS